MQLHCTVTVTLYRYSVTGTLYRYRFTVKVVKCAGTHKKYLEIAGVVLIVVLLYLLYKRNVKYYFT